MGHGIQVFNPDGSLQFDGNNRLFRTLSEVMSGTADGEVTVSGVEQGTVTGVVVETAEGKMPPTITPTSYGMRWKFDDIPLDERGSSRITILVY